MPVVSNIGSGACPPASAPHIFPRPILSSRPQRWQDIVVEIYRARDVNFIASHAQHVVSLQLRGSLDPLQQADAAERHNGARIGNINITPAGVSRHWRHDGVAEVLVLRIEPSLVDAVAAEEFGARGRSADLLAHTGIRDPHIEYPASRLLDGLKSAGSVSHKYVQLHTSLLALHLVRHYSSASDSVDEAAGKLSRYKLRQATDYIRDNLRDDLSLGKISEVLCMSPCHFAHVFKQTTGLAPHRYVIACRIERAKALLRESSLAVNEVAQMVGYANPSHFSTVFRNLTGQSPLRYRGED